MKLNSTLLEAFSNLKVHENWPFSFHSRATVCIASKQEFSSLTYVFLSSNNIPMLLHALTLTLCSLIKVLLHYFSNAQFLRRIEKDI